MANPLSEFNVSDEDYAAMVASGAQGSVEQTTEAARDAVLATPQGQNTFIYNVLLDKLMRGQPMTQQELDVLAYSYYRVPGFDPRISADVAVARLEQAEGINPGSTQVQEFRESLVRADSIEPDYIVQAIQDTIATLGVAGLMSAVKGGTAAVGASAANRAGLGVMEVGGQILPTSAAPSLAASLGANSIGTPARAAARIAAAAAKFGWRHKIGTGATLAFGGPAVAGAFEQGAQDFVAADQQLQQQPAQAEEDSETTTTTTTTATTAPPTQSPTTTQAVDPTTGRTITLTKRNTKPVYVVDPQTGQTVPVDLTSNSTPNTTPFSLSGDVAAIMQSMGVDPGILQSAGISVDSIAPPVPSALGDYTFDPGKFTQGANLQGQPIGIPQLIDPNQPWGATSTATGSMIGGGNETFGPGGHSLSPAPINSNEQLREETLGVDANIAPGGTIAQRAFQTYAGRTLLEWTAEAAREAGVPFALLYGLVVQESGYNPQAVGDNGQSRGLVQIYQPANPKIAPNQAFNPVFALRYAANRMAAAYNRTGSWEYAVIQHRSPAGAQTFLTQGKFKEQIDQQYLLNIFNFAAQSGLGNEMFGSDALLEALSRGSGGSGSGPTVAPFVAPDPAALREFANETSQEILGREITPEEADRYVERLTAFYRGAYNTQVAAARGQGGEDVDPGARFREELSQSDEGQFREETQGLRSMSEFVGEMGQILRNF